MPWAIPLLRGCGARISRSNTQFWGASSSGRMIELADGKSDRVFVDVKYPYLLRD
jgi:hypothetical protein